MQAAPSRLELISSTRDTDHVTLRASRVNISQRRERAVVSISSKLHNKLQSDSFAMTTLTAM